MVTNGGQLLELGIVLDNFKVLFDHGVMGVVTTIALWWAIRKDNEAKALNKQLYNLVITVTKTIDLNTSETLDNDKKSRQITNGGGNLPAARNHIKEDHQEEPKISAEKEID